MAHILPTTHALPVSAETHTIHTAGKSTRTYDGSSSAIPAAQTADKFTRDRDATPSCQAGADSHRFRHIPEEGDQSHNKFHDAYY